MTDRPRRAASLVKTGAIVLVCLLVVAGIFEYGRFLVTLHVMDNATHDSARLAVADNGDRTRAEMLAEIRLRVADLDEKIEVSYYDITVEEIGRQQSGIAVEVRARYRPAVPSFLMLNSSIRLRSKVVMLGAEH